MDEKQLQETVKTATELAARMAPEEETPEERAESAKQYENSLRTKHKIPPPPEPVKAEEKEEQPEAEAPKVEVDLEKLALATRALKRYGFTAKMLNGLSDTDKLEAGAKLLKIQEDNDRAQSDLLSYKQEVEKAKASAPKTPATPKVDIAKLHQEFAEEFGDKYLPLLEREDNTEWRERAERAEAAANSVLLELKRRDFAERFPEVKEKENWDRLLDKARKMRPAYEDDDECLADAAMVLKFGAKPAPPAPKADSYERHNGLTADSGRPSTGAKMSKKELKFASFVAFERGDKQEGNRLAALSRAAD